MSMPMRTPCIQPIHAPRSRSMTSRARSRPSGGKIRSAPFTSGCGRIAM